MLDPSIGFHADQFRKGILDVMVAEIQNKPGDDRCVILVGYETEMAKMLKVRY
jgi:hypothetical protein